MDDNQREAMFEAWEKKHQQEIKKCACEKPNPRPTNKNECWGCNGEIYKDYLNKIRWCYTEHDKQECMKENSIQTRFERMTELNDQIKKLKTFIGNKPVIEKALEEGYMVEYIVRTITYTERDLSIPKILGLQMFDLAELTLQKLEKEFNELNVF
jgi:hypothetical protein